MSALLGNTIFHEINDDSINPEVNFSNVYKRQSYKMVPVKYIYLFL